MLDKLNPDEFKRDGLVSVKADPGISADFIFVSFVAESLKNGRTVIYVSANRSYESFRIASNKMSVRLDSQRFHFISISEMIGEDIHDDSTNSKLIAVCSFSQSITQHF
jgi:KaiC/GvpD/RAD55 family RecA-like ATPase